VEMKAVLALLALLVVVHSSSVLNRYKDQFKAWQTQHNKVYTAVASKHRLAVFAYNARFVEQHDAEARGFSVTVNEFADLTGQEFASLYLGMNVTATPGKYFPSTGAATVDWRTKGAVTGVKNQGQCGSCWAFSTTGSTEAAHFLATGSLVSLSEQNLVDCSTAQGNMGCRGGLMDSAFKYIISKGVDTEASYPYTATGPNACRFDPSHVGAHIRSFTDVQRGSEAALQSAVNSRPVSVAIDASHQSFQLYHTGVYYEPSCSPTQLDHGVLAVGYGDESSKAYWIVKNSWGTGWGQSGYILMSRNKNNNCGIASMASFPVA